MVFKWRTMKLGDVINLKRGYDLPASKRIKGSIPILASSGLTGYHNNFKVKGPGVVTGRSGQIGKVFYTEDDYWPLNTTLYVEDFKKNYPKYVYYLLQTLNLEKLNAGSSVPTLNRNHAHQLEVRLPEYHLQKKIADTLFVFEEKIRVNNTIIKYLEEISRTLFKQWFIDFEFPNEDGKPYKSSGGEMLESEVGAIPNGWQVKSLDDVAKFQNGLAMQKFRPSENNMSLPVLKIRELNQGNTTLNSERCSLDIKEEVKVFDGDVIFSWSGTLLVKIWTGGNAGLNQHLFKVTSEKYDKWFYYLWTKYYLRVFQARAAEKATTMGHIKRSHLKEAKVFLPSQEVLTQASKLLQPLIEKRIALGIETKKLADLRDTLLPKLLAGEVDILDALEV